MQAVLSVSGFTMLEMVLEAAEPGPLRLTNDGAEDWHIFLTVWVVADLIDARGWVVSSVQERPCRYGPVKGQGGGVHVLADVPLCV